jgi:hypothetical protein
MESPPARPTDRLELAMRVAGTAVGVLGGFLTGLWEIMLSPPYTFGFWLPLDPVLAVVSNVGLVWFTRRVTGRLGLALLPGVVWFATMMVGSVKTTEGDLLITTKEWPGLLAMLLGGLAWAVFAYRAIGRRVATGPAAGPGTGSGTGSASPPPSSTAPRPPAARPASRPAPGAKPVRPSRPASSKRR